MSKVTNPQEKKQFSYALDCRNAYGANNKNSRKSIRKHKRYNHHRQRTHQKLIHQLQGYIDDNLEFVCHIQNQVMSNSKKLKTAGFKKYPDQPLLTHIKCQLNKRVLRFRRKKMAQQTYSLFHCLSNNL